MGQGMMMPKENGETGHSVRISLFFFEQKMKKKKKEKIQFKQELLPLQPWCLCPSWETDGKTQNKFK